ncbi:MAG: rhodanese-like domain-containing protein [Rhodobacteraceae bacterium]|nr:rhodanese-like domain-containing protein [Paracoccaceae bacterium]
MRILTQIAPFFALIFVLATSANAQVAQMTPDAAYTKALAGEIVLIDIRTPDEWAETGLPDVALQNDLYAPDFIQKLLAIRDQNPSIPLALICRTGNRSGNTTSQLYQAGLTNIIDVVEGVAGSSIGPGWFARGLPVRRAGAALNPAISTVQP